MQTTADAPWVRRAHLPPYDSLDFDSIEGAFSKVMHLRASPDSNGKQAPLHRRSDVGPPPPGATREARRCGIQLSPDDILLGGAVVNSPIHPSIHTLSER
jgi:hypothetical protein